MKDLLGSDLDPIPDGPLRDRDPPASTSTVDLTPHKGLPPVPREMVSSPPVSPISFFRNEEKALRECQNRAIKEEYEYDPVYNTFSLASSGGERTLKDEAENITKLQKIFPNLRDLAASSNLHNIKPGLLYRSARPFVDNVIDLRAVMSDFLGIKTVIDLRPPDLSSNKQEYLSRVMELMLYQPKISNDSIKEREIVKGMQRRQQRATSKIMDHIKRSEEALKDQKNLLEQFIITKDWPGIPAHKPPLETAKIELKEITTQLRYCDEGRALLDDMREEREQRSFHIVNFLDTPEFHAKVTEQLTQADSIHTVPFLAACKLGDKLLKTNNAEFYFSKFFISDATIEESYYEMIMAAPGPIHDGLSLFITAEPPILFHCTLGKDRTGIISLLLLHCLGAATCAIMFDYNLTEFSDKAFKRFKREFIVETSGLTERFTGAPIETMRNTIDFITNKYGSIDLYLDTIGFNEEKRNRLRKKYLIDTNTWLSARTLAVEREGFKKENLI